MHARTAKTYQVNLGTDPQSRIVCKAAPWQRNGTTMAIWLHRKKNGPTSWRDIWKYWVARRGVPIRVSRPSKPRIWAWQILKSPFCVLCAPKDGEGLHTHQHCWRGGWIWSVWCSQHFTVAYRGGAGLIRTRGRTRMMARMGMGMGFGRSLSLSGKRLVRRNRFSIFKRVLGAHACGKIWSLHKGRNQSNVLIWTIVL